MKRHSGARRGLKAFRFDVAAADEAVVMNPSNWPQGLRVRPWTVKTDGRHQGQVIAPGRGGTAYTERQQPSPTALSGRRLGAGLPSFRPHRAAEGPAADSLSYAQPSGITGSGPTSALVATGSPETRSSTAAFLIDGIHPEASDAQIRNLIWPLVTNLHQCQVARRGRLHSGAKAYRIVVDAADTTAILNPANWPAGLRVDAWSGQRRQSF